MAQQTSDGEGFGVYGHVEPGSAHQVRHTERDSTSMALKTTNSDAVSDIATCGGSVRFVDTRPAASARLQRRMRKLFTHAALPSPPVAIQEQSKSPFFRLPLELRQQIWEMVVTRPEDAKPAHFHVYDEVYDSCTYDPLSAAVESHARKVAEKTALLRTCQAIYAESVQYLYDSADFELVLLPGRARPERIYRDDGPSRKGLDHNLAKRNGPVGKLGDCGALLRRIRRATIIVQPGHSPDVKAYRRRIEDFLAVIANGEKLRYLCVKLNVHAAMDLHRQRGFEVMIDALKPLGQRTPQGPSGQCLEREVVLAPGVHSSALPTRGYDETFERGIDSLQLALGVPDEKVRYWCSTGRHYSRESERREQCILRGASGRLHWPPLRARPKWEKRRQAVEDWVGMAVCLTVALPVVAPMAVVKYVQRKRDKGERWLGEVELYRFGRR
ncbi:hypothetical protein LTR36_010748 [Oleoguttula mirabilis]|uniref:DUF7730 domain-containing protein n=1 Tax=Oleoguttula mirabilis TaxID=1507867 RepID=A0AAV9JSK9_9PEZI|nr:hypothetical protein LTR36_010748 [Oleoguttula mirabilis]